jgi:methenyltetrahydrofolate cyclohydrolase
LGDAATLTQLTFDDLTNRLASREPVPGGGSASALAGALAAALLAMVTELTPDDPAASQLGPPARDLVARLGDLAQADADAYGAVVTARRLPRGTDAERNARALAIRSAMADAAGTPLRTAEAALEVLDLAERLAPIGNVNAVSDVGVAGQLAAAAARGALLNVRINLPYLEAGEPLRATLPGDARRVEAEVAAAEDRVAATVAARMEGS